MHENDINDIDISPSMPRPSGSMSDNVIVYAISNQQAAISHHSSAIRRAVIAPLRFTDRTCCSAVCSTGGVAASNSWDGNDAPRAMLPTFSGSQEPDSPGTGGVVTPADCWGAGCWVLGAGCWVLDAGCWMNDGIRCVNSLHPLIASVPPSLLPFGAHLPSPRSPVSLPLHCSRRGPFTVHPAIVVGLSSPQHASSIVPGKMLVLARESS
jgi:hypothetical protein